MENEDLDSFKSNLLCVVCFVFFLDSAKPLSSEFKLSSLKTSYEFSWYMLCGFDEEMIFSSRRSRKQWADWVNSIALFVGHGSEARTCSFPASMHPSEAGFPCQRGSL